ncbi:MAG: hypothetical protein IJO79_00045 [Firmicutes bacterium]|nr:hypothetical protein [Bacillota bacterium]
MMSVVNNIAKFRGKIYLHSVIAAAVIGVLSLFILGPDKEFLQGLLLGLIFSVLSFYLLSLQTLSLLRGTAGLALGGYAVRMLLYCVAFLLAVKVSYVCGAGAVLGFMTQKAAIYNVCLVLPFIAKRLPKREPKAVPERPVSLRRRTVGILGMLLGLRLG